MTHNELLYRCRRILGLYPESSFDLLDCMRHLGQWPTGGSRAIAAEMLARELAEYVSDMPKDPPFAASLPSKESK